MRRTTRWMGALGALLLGSCSGAGLPGGGSLPGGPSMPSGGGSADLQACTSRDWGDAGAAVKLEAFLGATAGFLGATADVADSLTETCRKMAGELGVSVSGNDPQSVCEPVAAKLREELRGLRAEARLKIDVQSRPPRCEASMDAYAKCAAECQAEVDPGKVELTCEGGEIVGKCSGECRGQCSVEVQGACQGSCEGTCTAGCQGTCRGVCEGTCSQTDAQGNCVGRCDGACHGTCEGGCTGSCQGECWVSGQASCQGECRGGCSVEYTEPRCTGEVRAPRVEAECQASCDAKLSAEVQCEPGETTVVVQGDVASNVAERVERVRRALQVGYGELLALRVKLERLKAAGDQLVSAGRELQGAVGGLGLQAARAGQCIALSLEQLPRAVASVGVSVQVSVSLSASVTAG